MHILISESSNEQMLYVLLQIEIPVATILLIQRLQWRQYLLQFIARDNVCDI
jgi:hypothetical protein